MHVSARIVTTLLLLLTTGTVAAQSPIQLSVKPVFGFLSGYTKFYMDLPIEFEPGQIGSVKSELEYPLDVAVGGIQASLGAAEHVQDEWGIELGFRVGLKDPGGKMLDHDWIYIPGQMSGEFSYTASSAEMNMTQLFVEAHKSLIRKPKFSIGLIGGVRYQKISQDIIGYDGWYIDEDGTRYTQSGTELALTYEVTYKMPGIGLYTTIRPVPSFDLSVKGTYAAVWAKDVDDHVLRYRLAKADGTGSAFLGGIRARFRPHGRVGMAGPFIEGDVDVTSISVKATGNQSWYGDDPVSPDYDDTGDYFNGIPHNFTSRQLLISARLGWTF